MILTNIIKNKGERTRFYRFLVVGTIGAIVDFGTFNILTRLTSINPVFASILSFIAAIISNFIWNRYWTYPDSRSKAISRQLVEFSIVNIVGVGIRTPIFALLSKPLIVFFSRVNLSSNLLPDAIFLGQNTALAIAVIVVLFWNFFVNRIWTYNDVD